MGTLIEWTLMKKNSLIRWRADAIILFLSRASPFRLRKPWFDFIKDFQIGILNLLYMYYNNKI